LKTEWWGYTTGSREVPGERKPVIIDDDDDDDDGNNNKSYQYLREPCHENVLGCGGIA
jgi:hypothetical protein